MLKRLAVGGMAELFIARETGREEQIVIKRILPYLSQEQEFVQMFLDEARIAAQLHHPNIITVHELGKLEESIFLAMEYVEGVDLRKILQQEMKRGVAVPYPIGAYVTAQVCAGLFYAHNTKGLDGRPLDLVHRDVSPQNVMVAYDGRVKIVDFGIAKAGAFMEQSKPGVIKGKFLYLSPEQLSQDKLDRRADLFALGTMLYEVTTGKSPFHKNTTEAVILAIRSEEPPPPHQLKPDYPEALSRIIMKCLQKDRTRRYQQASEVQRDLEVYLQSVGGMDAAALSRYASRLFQVEPDPTLPGSGIQRSGERTSPERTAPERTAPLVSGSPSRRVTREIQGNIEGEDPRTQMANPQELARLQALRSSQPVVKPPVRRSGSAYPPVGGEEGTRTESASSEVSGATPSGPTPGDDPAPFLSREAPTRQDRPGDHEPVFDSFVGPPPRAGRPSLSLTPEHSTDSGDQDDATAAFNGPSFAVWRKPWVLGGGAFLIVAIVGVTILAFVQSGHAGDRSGTDPSPIRPISHPDLDPGTEAPPIVSDAGPPTRLVEAPPALDAGSRKPPPPPPPPHHGFVLFNAPANTRIVLQKKPASPGHKYQVVPGALKFDYACPGKHVFQARTVHVPAGDRVLTVQLPCKGR